MASTVTSTPTFDPVSGTLTVNVDVPAEPPAAVPAVPAGESADSMSKSKDGRACKVRLWGHSTDDSAEAWDPPLPADYDGMDAFVDTPFVIATLALGTYDTSKAFYMIKTEVYDSDGNDLDKEIGVWQVGPPTVRV